jgi:hypothetical protein
MFIDFFNNKTALWELWGESHNAALLYKDEILGLIIYSFLQPNAFDKPWFRQQLRRTKQSKQLS